MGLNFNGTDITDINFNGTEITKLIYNGVQVWEKEEPTTLNYFYFDSDDLVEIGIECTNISWPSLEYSTDEGQTWDEWVEDQRIYCYGNGQKTYVRGTNENFSRTASNYRKFVCDDFFSVGGKLSSLIDPTCPDTLPITNYIFAFMFQECIGLENADDLILPYVGASTYAYFRMFEGCIGLMSANFTITNQTSHACEYMFYLCEALENPPILPSTVSTYCYSHMFDGCSALVTAPDLPATTLASYCYQYMFQACISLENPPALPATVFKAYCYRYMFKNCMFLDKLPKLGATRVTNGYATTCLEQMFSGCRQIKISDTQTGEYQTAYEVPTGVSCGVSGSISNMFTSTGGTFTGSATMNTTYYTSNQIVT